MAASLSRRHLGLPRLMIVVALAALLPTDGWSNDATTNLRSGPQRPGPQRPGQQSDVKPSDVKSGPTAAAVAVDPESETRALALVDAYLPELQRVLGRLQSDRPREYERAIRDLARSARRLEAAKNRDERLFDIEVELLQAQNEVNLLTAKLKVRDSEKDRQTLRAAVARLQNVQLLRSEYDVALYRQRLEKAQQLLESAEQRLESKQQNADQQLEKTYLGLLKKAGREPQP